MVDIPDTSMNEDETLTLPLFGSDVDGDAIYFVVNPAENVLAELNALGDSLVLSPVLNWFGSEEITVHLFDGAGASDVSSFMLTVNPVDDVPIIREYIEDVVLYEDFTQPWSVNLNEVFLDIDGALTFTTELEDTTLVLHTLNGGVLTLLSEQDAFGETMMLVTAMNPMRESVTDSVLVTVIGINDAPIMTQLPDVTINEDESITIALEGNDVDGDAIYFAIEPLQEINASITNDSLTLVPFPNWNGEVQLQFIY